MRNGNVPHAVFLLVFCCVFGAEGNFNAAADQCICLHLRIAVVDILVTLKAVHLVETAVNIALIAATAIFFVALLLWQKWAVRRYADRLIAEALAATAASKGGARLKPESDYTVSISEVNVTCARPDGRVESVAWDDLQKVDVLTTEDGPFAPDVFWVLYGSSGGCIIPWGATGEKDLIDRLQALPDFRHDAVVNAASLTTENLLHCWERIPPTT